MSPPPATAKACCPCPDTNPLPRRPFPRGPVARSKSPTPARSPRRRGRSPAAEFRFQSAARRSRVLDSTRRVLLFLAAAFRPRSDTGTAVTLDELAGREPNVRNHALGALYSEVDRLPDENKNALLILLSSLIRSSAPRPR